jgi:hypothetical protein
MYPSFNMVDHLQLIKNSGVKIYASLMLSLCLPYADEKSQVWFNDGIDDYDLTHYL